VAVLLFSAAGAAIGSTAITGTILGMSGAAIGWTLGGIVGNALFPQKMPDQVREGPRIQDTRITSSAYGQVVPIIWGTYPVAGNIIWARPVREVATTTSQRVGGKGGGGSTATQTTYSYFADFAVLLCEGEIAGIRKIKINGEIKYDVSSGASAAAIAASALAAASVRIYTGSETQEIDPLIAAVEGADAPAYRGYAIMVIEGMDVTPYGGRPPQQIETEVVKAGATADLAAATVHTLGAADGSTAVVLGRGGNIYAGAMTSGGAANRWGFYAGAKLGSYVPPSFSYLPVGVTTAGEAIATGSFSGVLAVLHEDGSTTRYTGGFGNMGSGLLSTFYAPGIVAERSDVWWCRGDSGSSSSFFRAVVGASSLTTTQLTAVFCFALARNACGIAGRCYMHAATSGAGQKHLAYVATGSSSLVLLVAQSTTGGILVATDGSVWMGPADSVAERKTLRKYSADGSLLMTVDIDNTEALTTGWSPFEDPGGFVWAVGIVSGSNRRAYQIHPTTGQVLARSETFIGSMLGFTEDGRSVIWDNVGGQYTLKEIERLPRVSVSSTTLEEVVEEICDRVGYDPADLSLGGLTDTVRGYAIGRRMTGRSAIDALQPAYRFDLVESDDLIKAVKRTGTVVATIEEDDLGAYMHGDSPAVAFSSRRLLETELPLEIVVQYPDPDAEYEPGAQYARRLSGASRDPTTISVPVVLSANEAQQLADVLLYEQWTRRMSHTLSLPPKYSRIEPADVISVPVDGTTYTLLVVDKTEDDGLITLETVAEDAAAYTAPGVGASVPAPPALSGPAGPTVMHLLDIPILQDADDSPGFYAVAAGYYAGWRGAELWRSSDGGTTYERTETSFLLAAPVGAALTVLPNFSGGNVIDEHSTVEVYVFGDELNSTTNDLLLAGANAAYLGGELIQFRTATLIAAGKYRLSGLLRGRKGTEQFMGTHAIGDLFVVLGADSARRVAVTSALIGVARLYKGVTFGQTLAETPAQEFSLAGVGLKPLSPVRFGGGRDASGNLTITWVRRSRVSAEWRDYVDTPLGETAESYEVDIYDAAFTEPPKRTITGLTSPTTTYSAANQTTDFGSPQATVYARIYQVSAAIGRGFALQGSI